MMSIPQINTIHHGVGMTNTGRGAAGSARRTWNAEVAGSSPAAQTILDALNERHKRMIGHMTRDDWERYRQGGHVAMNALEARLEAAREAK